MSIPGNKNNNKNNNTGIKREKKIFTTFNR